MVNGGQSPNHWREIMKTVETNVAIQTQTLRFSAAAKAAMKQDELSVSPNGLENLTHALKFR
jgi:hypothetical protein